MRQDLPAAAARHPEWPIRLDHCFGRVILDAVCGAPWREVVASPAWRHLSPERLKAAVALADAVLGGSVDPGALNAASLDLRRRRVGDYHLNLCAPEASVSCGLPAACARRRAMAVRPGG